MLKYSHWDFRNRKLRVLDTEHEAWRQSLPWPIRWLWKKQYRELTVDEYFREKFRQRNLPPTKADGGTGKKEAL